MSLTPPPLDSPQYQAYAKLDDIAQRAHYPNGIFRAIFECMCDIHLADRRAIPFYVNVAVLPNGRVVAQRKGSMEYEVLPYDAKSLRFDIYELLFDTVEDEEQRESIKRLLVRDFIYGVMSEDGNKIKIDSVEERR